MIIVREVQQHLLIDMYLTTIEVYKQIIAQVSQAFPNLKYELINRECWSYITVYDKIIFTSREGVSKGESRAEDLIVQHRREIWKDAYFTTFLAR